MAETVLNYWKRKCYLMNFFTINSTLTFFQLIRPTTFAEISGNTSERAKQFSKILKHSHIPYQQGKRYAYVAALPSGYGSSDCRCILWSRLPGKSRKRMEDREKNSKKTEKKFLLFKEKVWQTVTMQNEYFLQKR